MHYFIEIKLEKNKALRLNILLNNVYASLHRRLYDMDCKSIGVSFPDYQVILGTRLRIHGSVDDLETMQSVDWLGDLKQYCVMSTIETIPEKVQYRTISRVQSTMSQAKLRRLLKRGTITEEEIKKYKVEMLKKGLDNPYIELVSASNGKLHRRYFQFGDFQNRNVSGEFDFFGLSKESTIPWF
ncbi:type I-F CRISPR-associated endoribonuclease Cas6/Csy4 [Sulfuricurvum sp.]|uniref:type I-F CRISPR-associated endoribonuclease Cas6/Csy4 n=1 Tax=Sulfuricurvum sp. TaxID=2025608 RepID=UPI002619ADDF|nr:type I-F CRISPR-associated endoribonuclease Cas6/Csy4 [Sulfuricurvum sp.]MDD3596513.1 type I-F CRISPR-associated endoribonuclease Cas6/Csy4 [Sulfuricurvum sp.]